MCLFERSIPSPAVILQTTSKIKTRARKHLMSLPETVDILFIFHIPEFEIAFPQGKRAI